jgi:rifampicin phosphotransferase
MAHELGSRLVSAGTLERAGDVYYLLSTEITSAINARKKGEPMPDLRQKAIERKELREARKRLSPPERIVPVPPDGEAQVGNQSLAQGENPDNVEQGTAVSPGKVTAEVSVICSPAEFDQMIPNSILVCPFTTPAWTQLFSHAVGLVTDIGSITSHGSIIAREYGIPAVLGLGDITKRLVSGQVISIDGDVGTITIEEGVVQTSSFMSPPKKSVVHTSDPTFDGLKMPLPFKFSERQRILGLMSYPFKAAFYRTIVTIMFLVSGPRSL